MRGKHLPELCHPIILLIHLSPLFLCSLQTFLSSSLSPQIVAVKLVGFCGFEVEEGEKRVCLCFFTGSLRRDNKMEWIVKEKQAIKRETSLIKVTFTSQCDIMTSLLHMQP